MVLPNTAVQPSVTVIVRVIRWVGVNYQAAVQFKTTADRARGTSLLAAVWAAVLGTVGSSRENSTEPCAARCNDVNLEHICRQGHHREGVS